MREPIKSPSQSLPSRKQGPKIRIDGDGGASGETHPGVEERPWWTRSQPAGDTNPAPAPRDPAITYNAADLTDNEYRGDVLTTKTREEFRYFGGNIGGMRLRKQQPKNPGKLTEIKNALDTTDCDVAGLQEHQVDTTWTEARRLCERALRARKLQMSSCEAIQRDDSFYKPGGAMILTRGRSAGGVVREGNDEFGRWSFQTLQGKNDKRVTFISAYQACKDSSGRGKCTAFLQQESTFRELGDREVRPRKRFISDLTKLLRACLARKEEIVLAGDFNEEIGEEMAGMTAICNKFKLVDILHDHHGALVDIPTYERGRKRIDYVLATEHAANCVIRCGYQPFKHMINSDHRCYFVDFDRSQLLGNSVAPTTSPTNRNLDSKRKRNVTKYLEAKYTATLESGLLGQIELLNTSDVADHDNAEAVMQAFVAASLSAEKACAPNGPHPFVVELAKLERKKNAIAKALSQSRTKTNYLAYIREVENRDNEDLYLLPSTESEAKNMLKEIQKEIRHLKSNAQEKREMEQIASIQSSDLKNEKVVAKLKRRIRRQEKIARMYRKTRYAMDPSNGSGISRLEVPVDPDADPKASTTEWKTLDLPDEIEAALVRRNQKHFGQAQGTPFTVSPLSDQLDFDAGTRTADLIVDGEYDTASLDEIARLLVEHLKQTNAEIPPVATEITREDFIGKIKTWKESTTTSPSGMHLGHYHALIAKHSHSHEPDSDECQRLDDIQSDLIDAHVALINYALRHRYSYKRWQQIVTMMIPKEKGNAKIHRLRVIHLYEADYNLMLSVHWRKALYRAEDNRMLNDGQYARPCQSSLDPVFFDEMFHEIYRLSRQPGVNFDNDAQACYDRIIVALAALASRKFGASRNVVFVNATTLKNAIYKLKTEHGLSEAHYQHGTLTPIHGTGQGSGNSPTIWCFISSILYDCHGELAHGADFESPDRSLSVHTSIFGFVDDSNGRTNLFGKDTHPDFLLELLTEAQRDAQLWNDLLWASGGKLELSKCLFQLIRYEFSNDGTPFLMSSVGGTPFRFTVTDSHGTEQEIKALSSYAARKTLGCHKSVNGDQKTQKRVLQEQSDAFVKGLARCSIDHEESWMHYMTVYMASLGYPLPVCFFEKRQLDEIQTRAMYYIYFPRCGYNRNTDQDLLYGPRCLAGAGFWPLYGEQGLGQIQMMLKFWRTDCKNGTALRIAVHWAQAACGTSVSIFQDVTTPLPHFDSKWLKSLRNFLKYIGGSMILDAPGIPPLQRQFDFHIMDVILESEKFTDKEIKQLDYCRKYLQAQTLADLSLPCGNALDPTMLDGHVTALSSQPKAHRFNQGRPTCWKLWKRANLLWADCDGNLREPLGQWRKGPQDLSREWPAYATSEFVFVRTLGIEQSFKKFPRSPQLLFDDFIEVDGLPSSSTPIHILPTDSGYAVSGGSLPVIQPTPAPVVSTFESFVSTLDEWEQQLFADLRVPDHLTMTEVMGILESEGCAVAASDGSVQHQLASFGWIISTLGGDRLVTCAGPVFGVRPSSFRTEGYGILSIIRFLKRLKEYAMVAARVEFKLHTDSLSMIKRVKRSLEIKYPQPNFALSSDWDVSNQITVELQRLDDEADFVLEYVKGHQDNDNRYEDLSLHAQLNCQADALANEYIQQFGAPQPTVLMFPDAKAMLQNRTGTVTGNYKKWVRYDATAPAMVEYTKRRQHFTDREYQMIDHSALQRALHRHEHHHTHYVKLLSDHLPTNKKVAKYDNSRTPKCPCCDHPSEDRDHILKCPTRAQWRRSFLQGLRRHLQRQNTRGGMIEPFLYGLEQWLNDRPVDWTRYGSPYRKALATQTQIGWRQVFSGRLSLEWGELQIEHLSTPDKEATPEAGTAWTTNTIDFVWTEWHALWTLRNETIHGNDLETRQDSRAKIARAKLAAVYDLRPEMLPRDQHRLYPTIQAHLESHTSGEIIRWINSAMPGIRAGITKVAEAGLSGVASIRSYFNPR